MKKIILFFLVQLFFFNVNLKAQIENRSVEGNWRSVKMKLVKDEFRPFYMYYPESDEDALRVKIKKGNVYFDREVTGFKSNTLYAITFADEISMMGKGPLVIVKSDAHHIIISVNDLKNTGNQNKPYYIAFERE